MARRIKWRNVLLLLLFLATIVTIIVLMVTTHGKSDQLIVRDVIVIVADSSERSFISSDDIRRPLISKKAGIIGKRIKDINTKSIEKKIDRDPIIRKADCYKTPSGNIAVKVWQRTPLLRVIGDNGDSYYMDADAHVFPTSQRYTARVIVVTGSLTRDIVAKEILPLVKIIENDDFWTANTQEIHRDLQGKLSLTPSVGDHIIKLGPPARLEVKLRRLKTFYKNGLSKIGWGDYESVSAEFDNQIICEKKKPQMD